MELDYNIEFKESYGRIDAYHAGIYLGTVVLSKDVEYTRYRNQCNGNKLLKVVRLETDHKFTNCGVATALLKEAFKRYPDYNFYLLCHPMPRGRCDIKHTTVKDLRRFYSKFGFEPCGELLPTMIRKANI